MADYRVPGVSSYSAQNPMNLGFSSRSAKTPQSLAESLVSSFTPEEALAMFEAREKDPSASFDQPTGQTLAEILGPPGEIPDISFLTELEGRVPADRTPEYRAVAQREEMKRSRGAKEAKDAFLRQWKPHLTEQERNEYKLNALEISQMTELGMAPPGAMEAFKQVWDTTKAQGRRLQEGVLSTIATALSPTEAQQARRDYMAYNIGYQGMTPELKQIHEDVEASQQVNLTDPTKPSNYPEVVAMVDSYKPRTPTEHSAEFWQNFGLWLIPNFGVAKAFTYAPKIPSMVTFLAQGVPKIIGRGAVGGVIDYYRAKLMGYSDEDAKFAGVIGGTMGVLGQTGGMFARWLKRAPANMQHDMYTALMQAETAATGNSLKVMGKTVGDDSLIKQGDDLIAGSEARLTAGQVASELGASNPSVVQAVAQGELSRTARVAQNLWKVADQEFPKFGMVARITKENADAAWLHFNNMMKRYAAQTGRGAEAMKAAGGEAVEDAARAIPAVDDVIDAGRAVWEKVLRDPRSKSGAAGVLRVLDDLPPSDWATMNRVLYRLRSFEDMRMEPLPEISQVLARVNASIRNAFTTAFKDVAPLSKELTSWELTFGNQAQEATRFFRNPVQSITRLFSGERPPRVKQKQLGSTSRERAARKIPIFQPEGTRIVSLEGKTLGQQIRNSLERQQALLELKERATLYARDAASGFGRHGGNPMQWVPAGAAVLSGRQFLAARATGAGFLPRLTGTEFLTKFANRAKTVGSVIDSPFGRTVGQTSRAYQQAGVPDFRAPGLLNPIERAFRDSDPTAVATPLAATEVLDEETAPNFYEQAVAELPSSATTVPEEE